MSVGSQPLDANRQRWARLRAHLETLDAADVSDSADRVGAVLVLLQEDGDDLEFVLTRRRDDLPTHPGQVSFAGGRREPGETTRDAALREAAEEIGLRPSTVQVVGRLPAFYIPPSRFWMAPVVGRWTDPHALQAQETEVAAIVRAPLSVLSNPDRWRKVRLSVSGWSWAWQLDDDELLWGATGMVIAGLLDVIEPDWHGGVSPGDLADDAETRPWLDPRLGHRVLPARLHDTVSMARAEFDPPGPPDLSLVQAAGRGVAQAVRRLHEPVASVVVLAGPGGTGQVGHAAATALRAAGLQVDVVAVGQYSTDEGTASQAPAHQRDGRVESVSPLPLDGPSPVDSAVPLDGPPPFDSLVSPDRPVPFDGTLPRADLYIDALVGGGLRDRLRGAALDVVLALRSTSAPVLAIDLPSGLHPVDGLVGDVSTATVTVGIGGMWPAVAHAGLAPFVGDLYVWRPSRDDLVRLVGGPDRTTPGGWRE